MYIAIYDKKIRNGKRVHITNLSNVSFTLNLRAFDANSLNAEGKTSDDCNDGVIYVICDSQGKNMYSGLIKNVRKDGVKVSFKGDDFRKIFDTEILLDFSQNTNQDFTLSGIFKKVSDLVVHPEDNDPEVNLIPIEVKIPEDNTDTTFIGDYTGQYFIKNAYSFLKVYMSYYNYFLDSYYDEVNDKIIFEFKKTDAEINVKLKDFINEQTTTDISINKVIVTIKTKTEDDEGNPVPRPQVATKYYYLSQDNNIYDGLPDEDNRIYPVRTKIFESEYLAQAQLDALMELTSNRYVENILITSDKVYNPIEIDNLEFFTKVNVYTEIGFYKTLPVSEKEITFTAKAKTTIIKLGFKRTLLTEIIKGGKAG